MSRILIAEDDNILRNMLIDFLSHFDFDVTGAEDGLMAWNFWNAEKYDILVTDINMPNMNGIDLLKKIKGVNQKFPIIVVTGVHLESVESNATDYGAEGFLLKPFKMKDLVQTINTVLQNCGNNA